MRVIVQDNLWFRGPPWLSNYELNGRSMIPVQPLLGLTDSSDPDVKTQELQWLMRYTGRTGSGLVIAQEWIRPGNIIERNLPMFREVFGRHGRRARWCIFYDPVLALRQRGYTQPPPYDFTDKTILELWKDDLAHLEQYSEDKKYFRLEGRPVLYVWAVHSAVHNADGAFQEAERRGWYVMGDVLGGRNEPAGMRSATGFVSVLPGHGRRTLGLLDEALPLLQDEYRYWSGRNLVPAASLQYDDTEFQAALGAEGVPATRILAANRAQVEALLSEVAAHAEIGHVFLGTANNWAEGTTLLPTARQGAAFSLGRIGHYRFEHLEAVRRVLFANVGEYAGPVIKIKKVRKHEAVVDFDDTDFLGKIKVRPKSATRSLKVLRGLKQRWRGEPGARITVVNLDGRQASRRIDVREGG